MEPREAELHRLLRAASKVDDASPPEMPFGFDTRVVARWRAQPANFEFGDVGRLVRRIAAVAMLVTAFAAAGTYWQLENDDDDDFVSPLTNAYAIADSAIEAGELQ